MVRFIKFKTKRKYTQLGSTYGLALSAGVWPASSLTPFWPLYAGFWVPPYYGLRSWYVCRKFGGWWLRSSLQRCVLTKSFVQIRTVEQTTDCFYVLYCNIILTSLLPLRIPPVKFTISLVINIIYKFAHTPCYASSVLYFFALLTYFLPSF